jgi:hypothetical protein
MTSITFYKKEGYPKKRKDWEGHRLRVKALDE